MFIYSEYNLKFLNEFKDFLEKYDVEINIHGERLEFLFGHVREMLHTVNSDSITRLIERIDPEFQKQEKDEKRNSVKTS